MLDIKVLLTKILDALKTDCIVVAPSSNKTLSAANTTFRIGLDTQILKVGSSLSLSTEKVNIGSGVNYVEVSGTVYFYTSGSSGTKNAYIYKNDTMVSRSVFYIANNYVSLTIAPLIIPVTSGDTIELRAMSQAGTTTVVGSSADGSVTRLMVKVIS